MLSIDSPLYDYNDHLSYTRSFPSIHDFTSCYNQISMEIPLSLALVDFERTSLFIFPENAQTSLNENSILLFFD